MKTIKITKDNKVVTVTLNRAERHNAMTPEMIQELTQAFQQLSDDQNVRVVILTGEGRSFCAGADLGFMRAAADYTFEENVVDGEAIFDLMLTIDRCTKPVMGRVNGAAIGGGVGLVSCCDSVVAVERAKFGLSEVRLGILPAVISPFVLAKIHPTYARELFLSGERFNAHRAQQVGLVHHVVPDETNLDEAVAGRVEQFLQAAPEAQAVAKELIRQVAYQDKAGMRSLTTQLIAQRRASEEGKEGMSAFLEKRPPWWQI